MGSGTLKGAFVLLVAFVLTWFFQLINVPVSAELVMSIAVALAALLFGNDAGQDIHARFMARARARG